MTIIWYRNDFCTACVALHAWVQKEDPGLEELEDYKKFMNECGEECTEYKTNMIWHCYSVQKKNSASD